MPDLTPQERPPPRPVPQDADTADSPNEVRRALGAGRDNTASLKDALNSYLRNCWRAPVDMPNPEELVVRVRIRLNRDGTLAATPQVLDGALESGNPFLRAAAVNARTAVFECEPYGFLPIDRYEEWREIDLNFDPTLMIPQ